MFFRVGTNYIHTGNYCLSGKLLLEIFKVLPSWIIERTSGCVVEFTSVLHLLVFVFFLHCFEVIYLLEQFWSVMFDCRIQPVGWKQMQSILGWNTFVSENSFYVLGETHQQKKKGNSPTASCPFCSFAFAGMSRPRLLNILPIKAFLSPSQFSWFGSEGFLVP